MGIELSKEADVKLKTAVSPSGSAVLWLGYAPKENSTSASVWFYCSSTALRRLRKGLSGYLPEESDDGFLIVTKDTASKDPAEDVPWFAEVVRTVKSLA